MHKSSFTLLFTLVFLFLSAPGVSAKEYHPHASILLPSNQDFPAGSSPVKPFNCHGQTESEIIGYFWILANDGCYYLGVISRDENGDFWFYPVSQTEYIGTSVKCMSDEEFAVLC